MASRLPACNRAPEYSAVRNRLAEAVREAGLLALATFRGELRSWIKGKSSPVSEADLAVDALLPLFQPGQAKLQFFHTLGKNPASRLGQGAAAPRLLRERHAHAERQAVPKCDGQAPP